VERDLELTRQSLQVMMADMDKAARGAMTSIRMLRSEAQYELAHGAYGFHDQVSMFKENEGGFFAQVPPGVPVAQSTYFFGKGPLPEAGSERAAEMSTVLFLSPLMIEAQHSVPGAGWVYYTSRNGFTNMYPSMGEAMAGKLVWNEAFIERAPFSQIDSRGNPERQPRWLGVYIDQAGMGATITLAAPIYDMENRYRAFVAVDFTLDNLKRLLLPQTNIDIGDYYVVNPAGEVLMTSRKLDMHQIQQFSPLLPESLRSFVEEQLQRYDVGCRRKDGWFVCNHGSLETSWQVVLVADSSRVYLNSLKKMKVEITAVFLLLLLLLGLEHRRRLMKRLHMGARRYWRIVESSDQGFWEWDIRERRFSATSRFDALLDYEPMSSPLRRRNWENFIHPDDLPRVKQAIHGYLHDDQVARQIVFRARARDGSWRWLMTQGKIVERDKWRQPEIIAGTLTDITAQQQNEADLLAAKQMAEQSQEMAEAANIAKSRFLATASHDLRQPLQASNLFISAIEHTVLDSEQKKLVHNMALATEALGELLNALLDISRLDAGVITPQLQAVEIYEIFQRIESEFASLAMEKKLRFKLFFPIHPLLFETDVSILMGLLRNLIGNAIRYTEWGGVLIGARLRRKTLLIQIWDTGIGIKEEDIKHIYEEFYQVDNPMRTREHGLGLGLSIVRRMADLLGYGLTCKSRYGRGTMFEVSIPVHISLPLSVTRYHYHFEGMHILKDRHCVFVEDNPLVADALSVWLASCGIHSSHFSDSDSALQATNLDEADFFITDFRIPGSLNGSELLAAIRVRLQRPIRGLIITGDTSCEQIDAFASTNWQVLHKPVSPDALLQALLHLLHETKIRPGQAKSA
jgi:PAS domain S-box-containing protein